MRTNGLIFSVFLAARNAMGDQADDEGQLRGWWGDNEGDYDWDDVNEGGWWGAGGKRRSGNVCKNAEGVVHYECGWAWWKSCTQYTCEDFTADTCDDYKYVAKFCPETCLGEGECKTIVDIAGENSVLFSKLVDAVLAADLADPLSTNGLGKGLTVLAPINSAFEDVGSELLEKLVTDEWQGHLQSLLLYHVIPSTVFAEDLEDGRTIPTLNGNRVEATVGDTIGFIDTAGDTATVVTEPNLADIEAQNGVIHGIDKVLRPPWVFRNIVELAVAATQRKRSELNKLVELVIANDLTGLLSEPGPYTVFAPRDYAFAQVEDAIAEGGPLAGQVGTILAYHVVPGIYLSTDLKDGMEFETLQGEKITVSSFYKGVKLNGNVRVSVPDLLTNNGVVHIVNTVLLPPSIQESIPCDDTEGDFTPSDWWNFRGRSYNCEIVSEGGMWGKWYCPFVMNYCPESCGQCV